MTLVSRPCVGRKVDFVAAISENSEVVVSPRDRALPGPALAAIEGVPAFVLLVEAQTAAPRPTNQGHRMAANWITDRPIVRRRPTPVAEAPRLELPLHRPTFERAKPREEAKPPQAERGIAVVDFYI